jgi:heme-degrading monooxygenase HmoA
MNDEEQEGVMYTILRRVTVQPGMVEESIRRLEQGLAPLVSREPGFVAFYLVQVEERTGVSVSIFETREQAEKANEKSLEWAYAEILRLAQGPAEILGIGEALVHRCKEG